MGCLACCFVNAMESNPEPGRRFQCSSIRPRCPNVLQLLSGLELLSTAAAANVNRRAALARPLQTVAGNRQVDVRVPCSSIPGADRADTPSGTFALDRPKRTSGTMALGPPAAERKPLAAYVPARAIAFRQRARLFVAHSRRTIALECSRSNGRRGQAHGP